MSPVRIGLVVNPVAGLGGRVGLKGSDGTDVQARARALGAQPRAGERARAALAELRARGADFELLTAQGPMGADAAAGAGVRYTCVHGPGPGAAAAVPGAWATSAGDTVEAVRALRAAGVRLLLFAGGDGTARDVHDALGTPGAADASDASDGTDALPVLGIPTGVKMHSAVFAVNPRAAGEVAAAYLRTAGARAGGGVRLRRSEVMDRDEAALRQGRVTARLHGWLTVPHVPARIQQRKTGSSVTDPESAGGIAAELSARAAALSPKEDPLLVLGPGTTTRAVAAALGAEVTPTGVNALALHGRSAQVVAADATGDELLDLTRQREALIALSPIGGQGFLLGRGNQQISPELIRTVGTDRLAVVCTEGKLAELRGRPLLLDSGDHDLDAALTGHRPVITGRRSTTMYRITT